MMSAECESVRRKGRVLPKECERRSRVWLGANTTTTRDMYKQKCQASQSSGMNLEICEEF